MSIIKRIRPVWAVVTALVILVMIGAYASGDVRIGTNLTSLSFAVMAATSSILFIMITFQNFYHFWRLQIGLTALAFASMITYGILAFSLTPFWIGIWVIISTVVLVRRYRNNRPLSSDRRPDRRDFDS